MSTYSSLTPQQITVFTWTVTTLGYAIGAVCAYNLLAEYLDHRTHITWKRAIYATTQQTRHRAHHTTGRHMAGTLRSPARLPQGTRPQDQAGRGRARRRCKWACIRLHTADA